MTPPYVIGAQTMTAAVQSTSRAAQAHKARTRFNANEPVSLVTRSVSPIVGVSRNSCKAMGDGFGRWLLPEKGPSSPFSDSFVYEPSQIDQEQPASVNNYDVL